MREKSLLYNFKDERASSSLNSLFVKILVNIFCIDSLKVEYIEDLIKSMHEYQTTKFLHDQNIDGKYKWIAKPQCVKYEFSIQPKVPKLWQPLYSNLSTMIVFLRTLVLVCGPQIVLYLYQTCITISKLVSFKPNLDIFIFIFFLLYCSK